MGFALSTPAIARIYPQFAAWINFDGSAVRCIYVGFGSAAGGHVQSPTRLQFSCAAARVQNEHGFSAIKDHFK